MYDKIDLLGAEFNDKYKQTYYEWVFKKSGQEKRVKDFQISEPIINLNSLIGWLDTSLHEDSEHHGEAAVRDGADSIEVVVLQRRR